MKVFILVLALQGYTHSNYYFDLVQSFIKKNEDKKLWLSTTALKGCNKIILQYFEMIDSLQLFFERLNVFGGDIFLCTFCQIIPWVSRRIPDILPGKTESAGFSETLFRIFFICHSSLVLLLSAELTKQVEKFREAICDSIVNISTRESCEIQSILLLVHHKLKQAGMQGGRFFLFSYGFLGSTFCAITVAAGAFHHIRYLINESQQNLFQKPNRIFTVFFRVIGIWYQICFPIFISGLLINIMGLSTFLTPNDCENVLSGDFQVVTKAVSWIENNTAVFVGMKTHFPGKQECPCIVIDCMDVFVLIFALSAYQTAKSHRVAVEGVQIKHIYKKSKGFIGNIGIDNNFMQVVKRSDDFYLEMAKSLKDFFSDLNSFASGFVCSWFCMSVRTLSYNIVQSLPGVTQVDRFKDIICERIAAQDSIGSSKSNVSFYKNFQFIEWTLKDCGLRGGNFFQFSYSFLGSTIGLVVAYAFLAM
ncbi:unnamed protein product [Orchesella dallaii]|uniref:Gustatory receptor n=1 Tax=Orchesella dallaii TaxID=48710 RepID=A0ABP1QZV3_9HEXA